MNTTSLIIGMSIALLLGNTASAAGDASAGQSKSVTCTACHGSDGNSTIPMYPHLAGQHAQYLENALKAYRDGQRTGGTTAMMVPMVSGLSDQDIADLSAFYSQQKLKQ